MISNEPLPRGLQDKQRLWDIVRYFRGEALNKELVTIDEYTELAKDHGAVARLEADDKLRLARLDKAIAAVDSIGAETVATPKYKGATCKGSLSLGTGCMNCERCVGEADVILNPIKINQPLELVGNDNAPIKPARTCSDNCRFHNS